jgi:PmbA protein
MSVFGVAREGDHVSSFQYTGGACHELDRPATDYFAIAEVLRDLERQIHTHPFAGKFVGDVILTPPAVNDFVNWFLGQLCDSPLISGSSLYRDHVGEAVGSPLLTLKSRFDAPGMTPLTSDAFVAPPVEILRDGVLETLTPSLYGSLKTGLAHVPVSSGWELAAGTTPRDDLISQTRHGALVGRLSMGMPLSNGDFSGVIKNSFAIEDGKLGHALSETMISGNVAQMLRDVVAVSRERIDTGAYLLPWVRIGGLHFS